MRRSVQHSALSAQPRNMLARWPSDILRRAFVHVALRSEEVERIEGFEVYFRTAGGDQEALFLLKHLAEMSL